MKRFAFSRPSIVALVAVGILSVAADTQAQTPLKGKGTGQVILQIDPTAENPDGVQVYHVQGTATQLGNVTGIGITFFRLDGSVKGSFVATAADGATIAGEYSGSFMQTDATTVVFLVDNDWGNGTGRMAGVTGQSATIAVLDALTGAFDFQHQGQWQLP